MVVYQLVTPISRGRERKTGTYTPICSGDIIMNQVQCPNCGGFNVIEQIRWPHPTNIPWNLLFVLFTLGIWIYVWPIRYIMYLNNPKVFPDPKAPPIHIYICRLCNCRWQWQEGTPLPDVKVNPDLIRKGAQRLKEEEERRRRDD